MTSVFTKSTEALNSLADVLLQLPDETTYTAPCGALSGASIGQHTRHIIELYQCLLAGYNAGGINYDDRQRNPLYENHPAAAVGAIQEIKATLNKADKELMVFCQAGDDMVSIRSNYFREVLYNLEHCIHHQALIKVALLSVKDLDIADGFGVAHSTLQYRQQCAQ